MLWIFVKIIYSSSPKQYQSADSFRNSSTSQNLLLTNRILMSTPNTITPGWGDDKSDEKISNTNDTNDDEFKSNDFILPKGSEYKLGSNQCGGIGNTQNSNLDALNNIVYGDTELTVEHMDCIKSLRNGFLYIGPHDLTKNFSLPNDSMMNHDMQQSARNQTIPRNRRDTSPVIDIVFRLLYCTKKKKKIIIIWVFSATRNTKRSKNSTTKHWMPMAFRKSISRLFNFIG